MQTDQSLKQFVNPLGPDLKSYMTEKRKYLRFTLMA